MGSAQAWSSGVDHTPVPQRAVKRLGGLALLGVVLRVTSGQAQLFAYGASESSNTVSVIDTVSNIVTATIPVEASPVGVAVMPDGAFVYVANY